MDPTSNRRLAGRKDARARSGEQTAGAARGSSSSSSSPPLSWLRLWFRALFVEVPAPVGCHASDQFDHEKISSSRAK